MNWTQNQSEANVISVKILLQLLRWVRSVIFSFKTPACWTATDTPRHHHYTMLVRREVEENRNLSISHQPAGSLATPLVKCLQQTQGVLQSSVRVFLNQYYTDWIWPDMPATAWWSSSHKIFLISNTFLPLPLLHGS